MSDFASVLQYFQNFDVFTRNHVPLELPLQPLLFSYYRYLIVNQSPEWIEMTEKLHTGSVGELNLYTHDLEYPLLGWCGSPPCHLAGLPTVRQS